MNVGERIGDYEIIAVLGTGGMGQVYKVRNVFSERIEAMKVLLPNMSTDPDLAQRFLREIQVQAALDHPNIARLHAAQRVGNQLIMVMELVEGSSLEKLMERGALPVSDSVNYTSQVLDALAYAHARGVVHRDVKPANIMRTPSGVVKLMDFGIAHMKADRRLTQTGTAVGSLYYMSPEQIQGGEPDPRSDLYALGITLYEMVTGRRPFQGDSDFSIMAAHMQQVPVAPVEIVPNVPADLSEIIVMAMAREPAARFQSAEAFHAALKSLALPGTRPAQSAVSIPPPPISVPPPAPPTPPAAPVYSMPPSPPPVAAPVPPSAPPYAPPAAAAPKTANRRGLYMALGSIATVLVLAAALIEIPKFRNAHAVQNDSKTETPAASAVQQQPTTADTGPALPAAAPPVAASSPAVPVQVSPPVTSPAGRPSNRVSQPGASKAGTAALNPQSAVAQAAEQQPAPQPPPVQTQREVIQQPVQPPVQPAPSRAPPAASAAELRDIQQQYDLLAIRAGTAKNGLRSLQQQMARQGLNLRGDVLANEARMDLQMRQTLDALRSGDADQARANMQMAERSVESIEKFLGR